MTEPDYNVFRAARLSAKDLRGLLLPVTTPFHTDGNLDLHGLRSNIRKWNQLGLAGYVLLGSTGERVHLDEVEYLEVIAAARAEVPRGPDGLAFVVGAGQESTRGTIKEIKKAIAVGADAVLVITPHFYRSAITQEVLIDHYLAVADASSVPVILYSMPALTGIKIEPQTVARLSQHSNIIGVKDSSADVAGLRETVKLATATSGGAADGEALRNQSANAATERASSSGTMTREEHGEFAVLTGNGTVFYDALCAGAGGAILAVGCAVPEMCLEIFRAIRAGENDYASHLQEKLTPLAAAVTTKYGIGGLKAALEMAGYKGGAVRGPLRQPDGKALEEIAQALTEARTILTAGSLRQVGA